MKAYVETLNDWRLRLAQLELEIALSEPRGDISWYLRIRAKVLRFLLTRYGQSWWEPSWPFGVEDVSPRVMVCRPDGAGRPGWDEGDAAVILRAAAGVREGAGASPELTWYEVCYCLLPWDGPWPSPGNEEFETRPRSREVIADRLRKIHALNTAPRRRWFSWGR